MKRRTFAGGMVAAIATGSASLGLALPGIAAAQTKYPDHPVRVVLSHPAGSGVDTVARVIGERLQSMWGQPIVVDNKPGGQNVIGAQAVQHAPADGYTLLYASTALAVHSGKPNPTIDLRKQFVPEMVFGTVTYVMFVSPNLKVNNFQELVAWAKANPGKLNYSSVGVGSTGHLGFEVIRRLAGFEATHIPFKSTGQTAVAVASGEVQVGLDPLSSGDDLGLGKRGAGQPGHDHKEQEPGQRDGGNHRDGRHQYGRLVPHLLGVLRGNGPDARPAVSHGVGGGRGRPPREMDRRTRRAVPARRRGPAWPPDPAPGQRYPPRRSVDLRRR